MELHNAKIDENEVDGEVVVVEAEAEKNAGETSSGGDDKFVETSMDLKPEEEASEVPEEKKTENGASVDEPSLLASVEVTSSGMEKPEGLLAKKKIDKELANKKILKDTPVLVAGDKNFTVGEGTKNDEQSAEQSGKETENVVESVADSPPRSSSGTAKDEEFAQVPADAEPSGEVQAKVNVLKSVGKRLLKGKKSTILQAAKERDAGAGNMMEPEKARKKRVKAKKSPAAPLATKNEAGSNDMEISKSLEVNTSEGVQQKNEDKSGLAVGKRRKRKRGGKHILESSNKKQRDEVVAAAADATQQKSVEEEKIEMDGLGDVKPAGLIFMCNAKTKPDCFRFSVMGVQENRKNYVMSIKPGIKLFLYDYDLKLLYGIFEASSPGGMKLERDAFGGSFPAQVRFKVVSDCIPLPESQFKTAIKENYNNRNKFKTELSRKQVFKLTKLFRPAAITAQLTHTLPIPVEKKKSDNARFAPGSSRTHQTRTHERSRNVVHAAPPPRSRNAAPPPRREEQPRDLFLSEREYRTYGLRREEPTQPHYSVLPPDSSYRDRVPLGSYRPSVDHERLLRLAELERHDRREVLHVPERNYHPYDHLTSRREVLSRNSPEPPASVVAVDPYRRDMYPRYEYRSPERQHRTYLASSGREDDDLYSRYVTPDSLAEYYRSSRSRYPESELLASSVPSRYAYLGSLPYSHR